MTYILRYYHYHTRKHKTPRKPRNRQYRALSRIYVLMFMYLRNYSESHSQTFFIVAVYYKLRLAQKIFFFKNTELSRKFILKLYIWFFVWKKKFFFNIITTDKKTVYILQKTLETIFLTLFFNSRKSLWNIQFSNFLQLLNACKSEITSNNKIKKTYIGSKWRVV